MPLSSILDAISRLVSTDPEGWQPHPGARPDRALWVQEQPQKAAPGNSWLPGRGSRRKQIELTGHWTAALEEESPVVRDGASGRLPSTASQASALSDDTKCPISLPTRPVLPRQTEATGSPREMERPRAKPEFTESLFFELVRSRQWKRAYDLLSPHCQAVWGSIESFASYNRQQGLDRIEKMEVKASRIVDNWADPEHGVTYAIAAELDTVYTFTMGGKEHVQARKIHLVAEQGAWKALCCPSDKAR